MGTRRNATSFRPVTSAPFAPLAQGEPILALIHEPRRGGTPSRYVAWASLTTPSGRRNDGQCEVRYDEALLPFPRPCPLTDPYGQPYEARLRAVTDRKRWGPELRGRSVPPVSDTDAASILAAAGMLALPPATALTPERATELVRRSVRDRGFRGQVLAAYAFRCADRLRGPGP